MSAIPYPYAFNGKRMENVELYISNQYDYGMRYYDARVGRFYSVDPLAGKYPWNSPYSFAENKPIEGIDLDGKELIYYSAILNDGRITGIHLVGEQNTLPWSVETILGTTIKVNVPLKRFGKAYVLQFGFYNYAFGSVREMFNAIAGANKYAKNEGGIAQLHALPNVPYNKTIEYGEEYGESLGRLGNIAAAGVNIGAAIGGISGLKSSIRDIKDVGEVKVLYEGKDVSVYRGGGDFTLKPNDVKINPETGLVRPTHGLSLDVNPETISKFGGAYKIESLPKGLKIIQRGQRLEHFEIVPENEMSKEEFQSLLNQIKVSPIK